MQKLQGSQVRLFPMFKPHKLQNMGWGNTKSKNMISISSATFKNIAQIIYDINKLLKTWVWFGKYMKPKEKGNYEIIKISFENINVHNAPRISFTSDKI